MSNFSKYVVKNNEEKIRAKIEEVLSNSILKQNLLDNASRYLEKEVEGCKDEDLDKYIQNCMESIKFVPAIMGSRMHTSSEKVVEVIPKGMLVVKDSERPLIRYYLGKMAESECTILATIIKNYRAIDNEFGEPTDLISTIRALKKDSEELKRIKSTAGKSVTFKKRVSTYFGYDQNKDRYLSKVELQNFASGENVDNCIYQGIEEGWLVESERGFRYNG